MAEITEVIPSRSRRPHKIDTTAAYVLSENLSTENVIQISQGQMS